MKYWLTLLCQFQITILPLTFLITEEDGSTAGYTVIVSQEGSFPQVENSGFDDWYIPDKKLINNPERMPTRYGSSQ